MSTLTARKPQTIGGNLARVALLVFVGALLSVALGQGQTWEYAHLTLHANDRGVDWVAPPNYSMLGEGFGDLAERLEAIYGELPPCPQRLGGQCLRRSPLAVILNAVGQAGWRLVTTESWESYGLSGTDYIFIRPANSEGTTE